jgi:hypothetical protein
MAVRTTAAGVWHRVMWVGAEGRGKTMCHRPFRPDHERRDVEEIPEEGRTCDDCGSWHFE